MPIHIKVARIANELDDVFRLRHDVYVLEDGKFGGVELNDPRIMDRFDAMPIAASVVAYDDGVAVGTIRVNLEQGAGLPADRYWGFASYKRSIAEQVPNPVFACAGMLAIREKWRRRRDVIQALLKVATDVCSSWGVSHVIASANHETTTVYEHLGFSELAEKVWVPEIGNFIVPMATSFDKPYKWAFSDLLDSEVDKFWIEAFSGQFERLLVRAGERVFHEGDVPKYAYLLDNGWVTLSRTDPVGRELTLATLSRGTIFGEFALIDEQPRSATATVTSNCELILLDRKTFLTCVKEKPENLDKLLKVFTERLRRTDDLAMVMAFAPQTERVMFAINDLRNNAQPDRKRQNTWLVKVGPRDIARSAGVREYEVRRILELEKTEGRLEYGEKMIRFLQ